MSLLQYKSILACLLILPILAFSTVKADDKVAFGSNRNGNGEIFLMDADGGNPINLTNHPAIEKEPYFNGTKIVFVSERDGNMELYLMNSDGSNLTRLTNNSYDDFHPSMTADGSKICFASNKNGTWDIFTINSDGTGLTQLTFNSANDFQPVISQDGSKITFASLRDGTWEIYVMNSDGSGQTRLTFNGLENNAPSFSPDNSKIVWAPRNGPNREIYVMNADGSNPTRLTFTDAVEDTPCFDSSGNNIYFTSLRDGQYEVYVMAVDGSGQTNVTVNSAGDGDPSAAAVSCQDSLEPLVAIDFINPNPVFFGDIGSINVQVSASDVATGGSTVSLIQISLDNGSSWINLDAMDGAYDEQQESASYSFIQYELGVTSPGVYPVLARAYDHCGNVSAVSTSFVSVYDSTAGFVTGGGWIESPLGAFPADTSLTGRANFGFVAKIPRGKTAPEGEVEFNFPAADLKFHAGTISSLKVNKTGGLGEIRGQGDLNGVTGFLFYLRAIDGSTDRFRIRIYTKQGRNETVYYDTVFDIALGGGQIVIHR